MDTHLVGSTLKMLQFPGNIIPKSLLIDYFAFEIGPPTTATPEPVARTFFVIAAVFLSIKAFPKKLQPHRTTRRVKLINAG
jgi:hypothetical protein